jgi:hypothetical protein
VNVDYLFEREIGRVYVERERSEEAYTD